MTTTQKITPCLWFNFNVAQVMRSMFTMSKIDIARLQQAYNQKEGE